jgi:hypothetical protein
VTRLFEIEQTKRIEVLDRMSNSPAEVARYEHKMIICPVCKEEGELYFRLQHGTRLWCVRHKYIARADDTYCHIGKYLPAELKDQVDGRKMRTLDSF